MRNKFSYEDLKSQIELAKKTNIIKTATAIDPENNVMANAMESICKVADSLDDMGETQLSDQLIAAVKVALMGKIKVAESKKKEDEHNKDEYNDELDADDVNDTDEDEMKEVFTVECPYCNKEFGVVVEYEDGDIEVETEKEDEEEAEEEGEEEAEEETEDKKGSGSYEEDKDTDEKAFHRMYGYGSDAFH